MVDFKLIINHRFLTLYVTRHLHVQIYLLTVTEKIIYRFLASIREFND